MQRDLSCPECGSLMQLKPSRFGLFYGCSRWRETGCKGSHGAHADGTPLGIPADEATKRARMRAHAVFNRLYEDGLMTRSEAYGWLQRNMQLSAEEAHIGRFTEEQCRRLIEILRHTPAATRL